MAQNFVLLAQTVRNIQELAKRCGVTYTEALLIWAFYDFITTGDYGWKMTIVLIAAAYSGGQEQFYIEKPREIDAPFFDIVLQM